MKKVSLISLGCPKNLVDSELMLGKLQCSGYKIVDLSKKSDITIINTCSFIEDAKQEAIDTIFEVVGLKTQGHTKKVVVTGCLVQRYKEQLLKLIPEIDLFVGTGEYHRISELFEDNQKMAIGVPKHIHSASDPRYLLTKPHIAYIKIAEGCSHGCAFCIIPKLRGKYRSRPINDIVTEAKNLIRSGAKEIILIGQDTTSYGYDLKVENGLSKLLVKLEKIPGDFWIRFLYSYPSKITPALIKTIKNSKKICKYLDIPLQHISDKVLKPMGRREKETDIKNLLEKLKKEIPDITLRTSLIVGFPGETKKDFEKLLNFVREGWFDHLGVFTYSKEEGTTAAKLRSNISKQEKIDRWEAVMEIQAEISHQKLKSKIGSTIRVLMDSKSTGRSMAQTPEIDGITKVTGATKSGQFYSIVITKADDYDLCGKIA